MNPVIRIHDFQDPDITPRLCLVPRRRRVRGIRIPAILLAYILGASSGLFFAAIIASLAR